MLEMIIIFIIIIFNTLIVFGFLIEKLEIYPKLFKKTGKKSIAQSIEERDKYLEIYKKMCIENGDSLFFYIALIYIDKYGKILVKIFFMIVLLNIAIILIKGILTGQLKFGSI